MTTEQLEQSPVEVTLDSRASGMAATPLPGVVEHAPPNQRGFDTSSQLLGAVIGEVIHILGAKFAIRYIPREATEQPGDLTHDEAVAILNSGLALMPVQHVAKSGWTPSATLGTQYGQNAAAHAAAIGFPAKVNVWCDLEEVAEGTPEQAIIDYCNHWSDAVSAKGFTPGLYVGARTFLNAAQLGALKFTSFWNSLSTVPVPAGRGFQLVQTRVVKVLGISLDLDTTQNDEKHGSVQWLRVRK